MPNTVMVILVAVSHAVVVHLRLAVVLRRSRFQVVRVR